MKKRKRNVKVIMLIMILCITIGYAALTSNLNIVGTSNINNASWDVHWNNVQVTNGSVTGTNVTTAAHILSGNTEVEYSITLGTPGDFYEFTVDAVNAGSIDAMIGSFSNKVYESNGTTERTLPEYLTYTVTYSDGIAVAANHLLSANTTETYKVRVEFKTDINASQLPSSTDTLVFKFNVSYIQADSNATPVSHSSTVYTANIFDNNYSTMEDGTNTSVVWIGQAIPNGITTYQTPELAMEFLKETYFWEEHPFFLKNIVVNNIVTDSYVGFVITPEMAAANPGMTAGTYYLKGEKIYELVNGNWQCMSQYDDGNGNCIDPEYNTNKATLLSVFGSSYCTDYSSFFVCTVSGLDAYANSFGSVSASGDSCSCYVSSEGSSGCNDLKS